MTELNKPKIFFGRIKEFDIDNLAEICYQDQIKRIGWMGGYYNSFGVTPIFDAIKGELRSYLLPQIFFAKGEFHPYIIFDGRKMKSRFGERPEDISGEKIGAGDFPIKVIKEESHEIELNLISKEVLEKIREFESRKSSSTKK